MVEDEGKKQIQHDCGSELRLPLLFTTFTSSANTRWRTVPLKLQTCPANPSLPACPAPLHSHPQKTRVRTSLWKARSTAYGATGVHYRSDHHRYNMKRRVASLPPVSAAKFNEKVLERRQETAIMSSTRGSLCEVCK